ncbi:MAG TPA: class I SAM-dependent methyltransferase [Rhizomicrobium sp.]|jgi:ubiquinone/menaquinone biosynthesis C-methylase UbiE
MSQLPSNLRPDAFAGLAGDYVRYRVPYPRAVLEGFLDEARLPRGARLLDLACGPGRVALPIADRFAEVWAVDLEPDMIEAGRREAKRLGLDNVHWAVGRAEDFDAAPGRLDLITIGEAFHRLDRSRIAAEAYEWLKPGGGFVTLGPRIEEETAPPWRRVAAGVVRDFIGEPARRLGAANATADREAADEMQVIRDAGFRDLTNRSFAVAHDWTLETLLGYARSNSTLSARALAGRHAAFEAALSSALLTFDPSGRYREEINWGYTFARRP